MDDPFEWTCRSELAAAVRKALEKLKSRNARAAGVSRIHIQQGKTQRDTGRRLRLSRDQVARLKTKAKEFLASELAEFQDYWPLVGGRGHIGPGRLLPLASTVPMCS